MSEEKKSGSKGGPYFGEGVPDAKGKSDPASRARNKTVMLTAEMTGQVRAALDDPNAAPIDDKGFKDPLADLLPPIASEESGGESTFDTPAESSGDLEALNDSVMAADSASEPDSWMPDEPPAFVQDTFTEDSYDSASAGEVAAEVDDTSILGDSVVSDSVLDSVETPEESPEPLIPVNPFESSASSADAASAMNMSPEPTSEMEETVLRQPKSDGQAYDGVVVDYGRPSEMGAQAEDKQIMEETVAMSEAGVGGTLGGSVAGVSAPVRKDSGSNGAPVAVSRSGKSKIVGFLISYDEDKNGQVFEICAGRWLLTSRPTDHGDYILIDHETISPLHAIIRATNDGKVQVLDQLSEFGTGVIEVGSDEEKEIAGAMVVISHGDRVRFGERNFVFCLVPQYGGKAKSGNGAKA